VVNKVAHAASVLHELHVLQLLPLTAVQTCVVMAAEVNVRLGDAAWIIAFTVLV
jgi:hypothetical protein